MIVWDTARLYTALPACVNCRVFQTVSSTQDHVQTFQANHIDLVLAETQTHGVGQFNRHWHSPFGQNIYLSFGTALPRASTQLNGLTLALGLVLCESIEKVLTLQAPLTLKWPNDLFYEGQKLGGILVRLEKTSSDFSEVCIGIGVNVNMTDSHEALSRPWTSLQTITGHLQDRHPLLTTFMQDVTDGLECFSAHGFSAFHTRWTPRDCLKDTSITLQQGTHRIKGTMRGIDEHARLLLEDTDGQCHAFSSGDVQICKE